MAGHSRGTWSTAPGTHTANIHRSVHQDYVVPATGEGRGGWAEARGTYGVMMRERAELVRGVQAGEVSGVALQQERKGQSAVSSGTHSPNSGQQGYRRQHRLTVPPHTFLRHWDPCTAFPLRALGQLRV